MHFVFILGLQSWVEDYDGLWVGSIPRRNNTWSLVVHDMVSHRWLRGRGGGSTCTCCKDNCVFPSLIYITTFFVFPSNPFDSQLELAEPLAFSPGTCSFSSKHNPCFPLLIYSTTFVHSSSPIHSCHNWTWQKNQKKCKAANIQQHMCLDPNYTKT